MSIAVVVICVFLLVFLTALATDDNSSQAINSNLNFVSLSTLDDSKNRFLSEIEHFLPPSFYLEDLVCISDVKSEMTELQNLMGVKRDTEVSREAIQLGILQLIKKQKFKYIRIEKKKVSQGYALTLFLGSEWTCARLKLRGTLIGKDRYKQQYPLEPGDIFNPEGHALGLQKMKKALAAHGYFNAQLIDSLIHEEANKSIVIDIEIKQGNQFVLDDVQVLLDLPESLGESDRKIVQENIQKMLRTNLSGSYYSKNLLDREAKKLHEYLLSEGFCNSTIALQEFVCNEKETVQLCFRLVLKQRHLFEFYGNTFFNRRQLLDQIFLFGKSAVLIPASLIAEELTALYKKVGFWHAEIAWKDDGERISFFVKESKRIGISSMVIEGAHELSEKMLIKKYGKKLLKSRYFDGDILKNMLDEMGKEYLRQGFWDFSVTNYEYIPLSDNQYQLKIEINEGKRRWLVDVALAEDFGLGMKSLVNRYQSLVVPIPFDIGIVQEQRQAMLHVLHKSGRLYLRPYPELIELQEGVKLLWKFSGSSEVVRFGDTILLGSGNLPASVIMRELAYQKGEVWNQKKIERSVARLKQLGVFDTVALAPEDLGTIEPSKTLLLKCVEDAPYEVRARAGVQGVNKNIVEFSARGISYKAGGSFFIKNPTQRADSFRLDVDFSRFMHDIVASYQIPWIFGFPLRTELKGYSSRYDQPIVIGSPKVLYQSTQDGFLFGFSREYVPIEGAVNIGWDILGLRSGPACVKKDYLARTLDFDLALIDEKVPYFFIEPTIYRSSLDNKIQPTRGFLSLFSLKGMVPLTVSHAAFLKILIEQSAYIPLGGMFVLALRGRAGALVGSPLQRINPIERFYLGGAYSVRSYEPDHAPPLNIFRDDQGCLHLVPIGGKSMFNFNVEMRFPLYGNLSGVAFSDIGALSSHGLPAAVREHHFVGAAGVGLRINTVVGPIRFDIGWKLNRSQFPPGFHERSYAWFLALGNAF